MSKELLNKYAAECGIKRKKGEKDGPFQARVLDAIDKLADKKWDALSEECKSWSNEINAAAKKAKAEEKKGKKGKIDAAKAKAKEAAKDNAPKSKGFGCRFGTNGHGILQIVANNPGSTEKEIVKLVSKSKTIKTSNAETRVHQVLVCLGVVELARQHVRAELRPDREPDVLRGQTGASPRWWFVFHIENR